jgi:hypothetical protein
MESLMCNKEFRTIFSELYLYVKMGIFVVKKGSLGHLVFYLLLTLSLFLAPTRDLLFLWNTKKNISKISIYL